jgi:hypothetical protein
MNVWLKSLGSLALFLVVGYFFFRHNWTWVMILTAVVVFHEMGHFFAMKVYKYQELGIFFIPLMGAYVSGKKQEGITKAIGGDITCWSAARDHSWFVITFYCRTNGHLFF